MWYTKAGCSCSYKYGKGLKDEALNIPPFLKKFWKIIEGVVGLKFNSVLVNYYGNSLARVKNHSDDEKIFFLKKRDNYTIASVSILVPREFVITHKASKMKTSIWAEPFDILLMMGKFQWEFRHMVPKDTMLDKGARINFTFRNIIRHTPVCSMSQV